MHPGPNGRWHQVAECERRRATATPHSCCCGHTRLYTEQGSVQSRQEKATPDVKRSKPKLNITRETCQLQRHATQCKGLRDRKRMECQGGRRGRRGQEKEKTSTENGSPDFAQSGAQTAGPAHRGECAAHAHIHWAIAMVTSTRACGRLSSLGSQMDVLSPCT